MCSVARENRSLLLLLISRLKIKQTRCEGWDDCATPQWVTIIYASEWKTTAPYDTSITQRSSFVKVRHDHLWRKRISSTVFHVRARTQLTLHNQTQSAGRENQFVVPRRALDSWAPSRWSRLNIAEWSPE